MEHGTRRKKMGTLPLASFIRRALPRDEKNFPLRKKKKRNPTLIFARTPLFSRVCTTVFFSSSMFSAPDICCFGITLGGSVPSSSCFLLLHSEQDDAGVLRAVGRAAAGFRVILCKRVSFFQSNVAWISLICFSSTRYVRVASFPFFFPVRAGGAQGGGVL